MFNNMLTTQTISTLFTLLLSLSTCPSPVYSYTPNQSLCTPNTKYPNQCRIATIYNNLGQGNYTAFFSQVASDVHWTLMGTHPLAGEYSNRTIFLADAIVRLDNVIDPKRPTSLELTSIVGGGDEEWSLQELHALGVCKNGE